MMLKDRYLLPTVLCAFCAIHLLIVTGCTEHYDLECVDGWGRLDFYETLRASEVPTEKHFIFQPQINSSRYVIGFRFPRFDYDPMNHAMPDTSRWDHLINGMGMRLYDEYGQPVAERKLNTIEERREGFWASEKGFSVSLRDVPEFKSDRTYRLVVNLPAIYDPYDKYPDMYLRVAITDAPHYFGQRCF
jgi:hypothetical protein